MSTTTLPKISPISTPVPTKCPRTLSASLSSNSYGPYPPRELSTSMELVRIPQRINPLSPPPPKKRINMAWETVDQHWHNEARRIMMQQREHQRYHSAWSKPFYGQPAEKEQYRKHFRETLKQQMQDKDFQKNKFNREKTQESAMSIAYDNKCRKEDVDKYINKHLYLQQYRNQNKTFMEDHWETRKQNKFLEDRIDREKLRYNPINWSCSLK
ncbi:uncharacterized protein LOC127704492 [Mytilus californianus]|uniref:uncharacterized protein LOC127704492 n=1 Tax=Mytilus californianus TaxID=6549 RepID=UPI00224555AD|nr:uncharacterized protein LOC127704492 [Mytilus californianus]